MPVALQSGQSPRRRGRGRTGSEGTNGLIEVATVENEVSVLVSIKPLRGVKAVVDMGALRLQMKQVRVTIPTRGLSNGQGVANAARFGPEGWRPP